MRFEVVTVVLQIDVLWYVMLCSWVHSLHFRGLYCLPLQVQAVRKVRIFSIEVFLITYFHLVLYVVCFLLGNSLVSEFYMPTFRNTLSVPSS